MVVVAGAKVLDRRGEELMLPVDETNSRQTFAVDVNAYCGGRVFDIRTSPRVGHGRSDSGDHGGPSHMGRPGRAVGRSVEAT